MISTRTHTSLLLILLLGVSMLAEQARAQTNPKSNPAPSQPAAASDASSWLFPVDKLNDALPRWLRMGGEYRDRLEGPIGINFTGTNDFYLLDRFRLTVAIQPKDWLRFSGKYRTLLRSGR